MRNNFAPEHNCYKEARIDKNAYSSTLDEVKSYFDALKYCVDILNEIEEIKKQLEEAGASVELK